MKKFFKKVAAVAGILGVIGVGVSASTAEAFNLGDIGAAIGLGNSSQVLDMDGLESDQKRMLNNLYYSTALIQAAYQNVKIATDDSIANKSAITADQAAKSAVKSSDAGLNMKNGAEQNKQDAENMKKYLSNALASGDEEKLKQIDALIEVANTERLISDSMAGVAGVQAAKIVKTGLTNFKDPTNLAKLQPLIKTAKEAQALLKIRSQLSKVLNTATQEYRKARAIKDPSKKESEAAAAQIEKG